MGLSAERSTLWIGRPRVKRGYAPGGERLHNEESIVRIGYLPLTRNTRWAGKTGKNGTACRGAFLVLLVEW